MKRHYSILIGILILGTVLRFWQLGDKPLWLDEVLTALFSLGKSDADLPLRQMVSLTELQSIFAVQPASCAAIARAVRVDSTHPPLFFCLMHLWLRWLRPDLPHLAEAVRSLPALFGVGAIAAMYGLGRVAFSPTVGLMSAALMAVSPFAIYLSQEARHYTLPMLLITLGLWALAQIQRDLIQGLRSRSWVWLGWIGVNGIGLYVHYFYLLAVVAQAVTLLGILLSQKATRRVWLRAGFSLGAIALSYLPWLPVLLGHSGRSEADWLTFEPSAWTDWLAPLAQILASWVLMVIMLPVEHQPIWVAVIFALVMLGFMGWLTRQVYLGWQKLWQMPMERLGGLAIASFTLTVLLQFWVIIYVLHKDLTLAPRYSFVYYPGMCALLGACLVYRPLPAQSRVWRLSPAQMSVLLAGLLSYGGLLLNLTFYKPFLPDRVAQALVLNADTSLALVVGYQSFQEVALGLSYALELQPRLTSEAVVASRLTFLPYQTHYDEVGPQLQQMRSPSFPQYLWMVGRRGMDQIEYPPELQLTAMRPAIQCQLEPDRFGKTGFPYQRYQCVPNDTERSLSSG